MTGERERSPENGPPEPRPSSVTAVVRRTQSALRAVHALEAGLLCLAAALAVRAAAALSSSQGGEVWAVALIAGLLAAAAWWREHRVPLPATADELDRRLLHQGALVTAFELETRGALAPMEALVRERVLARLRPDAALRALFPPLLVPVGAPVLAALALVVALDARERSPADHDLGSLGAGLGRTLAGVQAAVVSGAEEGWLAPDGADRARQTLGRLRELESTLEREEERDSAALHAALEALDRDLAELTVELPPASSLNERFREARAWLDAVRAGLPPAHGGAADPGGTGLGAAEGTSEAPDGTITGSSPGSERPEIDPAPPLVSPPPPDSSSAPALPPGGAGASWWPPEYDAVVERWVELRRAALADEQR